MQENDIRALRREIREVRLEVAMVRSALWRMARTQADSTFDCTVAVARILNGEEDDTAPRDEDDEFGGLWN